MAGIAATASIAKSAANNISFFNFTPPYERAFNDVAYSFIHIPYCQYLKCSFFLLFLKKLNIIGPDGEAEISRRISPEPPHIVSSIAVTAWLAGSSTCARFGAEATNTVANVAADNINFFKATSL
jgi:hypothetical protein